MKKSIFGQGLAVLLVVIGICAMIGAIGEASEPKCIKPGCDNKQASNSNYCYLHKPSTSSSSYSNSSYSNKSSSSSDASSSDSNNGTLSNGTLSNGDSSSADSSSSNYNNESTTTNSSTYNSNTKKSYTGTSSNKKNSTYDSYDDGYDDIYMAGDYDYDRYDWDSDYADGVDDAMDEFGEDW